MVKTSAASVVDSLVKVASYCDDNGLYEQADNITTLLKTAQSAISGMLNDVPGGFYLENLNNTAYGLKNGMGGYPLSGHSYWDDKGGEQARQVDLRNTMMGQGGMNAQDLINFTLWQAEQQRNDPNYKAWSGGQFQQIQRDVQKLQQQLQNPNLSQDDRRAMEQAISTYSYMLQHMPQ